MNDKKKLREEIVRLTNLIRSFSAQFKSKFNNLIINFIIYRRN